MTTSNPHVLPLDRTVLDALAEGIVWQDAQGQVVHANPSAASILGRSVSELLGRPFPAADWYGVREDGTPWPGEQHPAVVALQTAQPQRDQVIGLVGPDQKRRWVSVNAMPIVSADSGTPTGVVSSWVDITEQLESRRRLEAANRELTDLYNHAPSGYHVLDAQGRYVRVNDTALKWLGCTREELVGRLSPADFMTAESLEVFRRKFPLVLAGEKIEGQEIDMVGRDGQTRRLRVNATPLLDSAGRFVSTGSVLDDITELHQNRIHLERLCAQQAAVLDNDLVGIVRLRGRKIEWTNRAFNRMFGYRTEEIAGKDTDFLYADKTAFKQLGELAYPVLKQGGVFRVQLEMLRKDGRSFWMDCCGFMLDKSTEEAIWFSNDITEQRKAEELRIKAAQLEAENQQLLETNRLQQLFLSNMSHELRTPLNAVIGFSHLLQLGKAAAGSEKQATYLKGIEGAGKHLLSMIDALLETAAGEKGQLTFRAERIDPAGAIQEVIALLEQKAAARHIHMEPDVAKELPDLHLDPLRLRQVLLIYIDNAIKFSHDGGRIVVRLRDAGSERFRIEVEDRGIGIPADELPKLFTKFNQISAGSTKCYQGTGASLALAKLLVEAQDWLVEATSTLGAGSVFSAELPMAFPLPAH